MARAIARVYEDASDTDHSKYRPSDDTAAEHYYIGGISLDGPAQAALTALCEKLGTTPEMLQEFCDQGADIALEARAKPLFRVINNAKAPTHHPSIPWVIAQKAYAVYSTKYGTAQSLEKLNERGGLHSSELDELYPAWRTEVDELTALRARSESATAAIENAMNIEPRDPYTDEQEAAAWSRGFNSCRIRLRQRLGAHFSQYPKEQDNDDE